MKRTNEWERLIGKMEEFMCGDKGIVTTAFADANLDTYILSTEKVIEIIKDLKEIENAQEGLFPEQEKQILMLKKHFFEIDNGTNGIKEMYEEIGKIYNNIEEY